MWILDLIHFWLSGGVFALLVDWLCGWPRALADPKGLSREVARAAKEEPDMDTTMYATCCIMGVFLFMGPFAIFLSGIYFDDNEE